MARPWSWVSYWREDREYCERKQPPSGPGESLFSLIQGFKYMCMRFSYLFLGDQRRLGQASTYGQSCQSLCCLHTQTEHIDERSVRPSREVIKLFFMLNSAEQEIILLINVKMPTIVGILTFISMINTTSERLSKNLPSFVGIIVLMSC